jgi:hypothetical protein
MTLARTEKRDDLSHVSSVGFYSCRPEAIVHRNSRGMPVRVEYWVNRALVNGTNSHVVLLGAAHEKFRQSLVISPAAVDERAPAAAAHLENTAAAGACPRLVRRGPAQGEDRNSVDVAFVGIASCMGTYLSAWRAPRKSSDENRHALTKLSVRARSAQFARQSGPSRLRLTSQRSSTARNVTPPEFFPANLKRLARSSPQSWSRSPAALRGAA